MHKQQNECDMANQMTMVYNRSYSPHSNASKFIAKMEKLLSDPKHQKEYQAFFKKMEKIFVSIGIDEMTKIMQFGDPARPLLGSEIRAEDLFNAYLNFNGRTGDLHILCTTDDYWDYSLIYSKLKIFLLNTAFEHKDEIAEAIVKEVIHPDLL